MSEAIVRTTAVTNCSAVSHILLVSVVRGSDGDGLALVRDHHERHRCPETWLEAAGKTLASVTAAERGKYSRNTPGELMTIAERVGFDGTALATASRLVAKVDSAAVQDGFQLYLHGFIVTDDGNWAVVQQEMNGEARQARRYHWLSEGLKSFVEESHSASTDPGKAKS